MGFVRWLRNRSTGTKVATGSVGTLAVIALIKLVMMTSEWLDNTIKNHNEARNDPIVRLWKKNTEEFTNMLGHAETSLRNGNKKEIIISYEEFEKNRQLFADSLFNTKHFDYLETKGWLINRSEQQVLRNMKSQYDNVMHDLEHAVQKMQESERIQHMEEQANLRKQ